jgi:hypothetical protein
MQAGNSDSAGGHLRSLTCPAVHVLLEPMIKQYLPEGFLGSRITWTILSGLCLTPIVVPSRTLRTLRVAPVVVAMFLPIVAFLVIGRTVEVTKAAAEAGHAVVSAAAVASGAAPAAIVKRGLRGLVTGSAGSGLSEVPRCATTNSQQLWSCSSRPISSPSTCTRRWPGHTGNNSACHVWPLVSSSSSWPSHQPWCRTICFPRGRHLLLSSRQTTAGSTRPVCSCASLFCVA